MRRTPPPATTASTLTELRGGLGTDAQLVGYDLLIDVLRDRTNGRPALMCLRGSRWHGGHVVPSVLAVLDDVIWEAWLEGREVHTATSVWPGAAR